MLDKKGNLLESGQTVLVPAPTKKTTYTESFVGTIADILDSRHSIIVIDRENRYHEIDPDIVTVK